MHSHVRSWVIMAAIAVMLTGAVPPNQIVQAISHAPAANGQISYLPLVKGPSSLAGVFDCTETEFGLGWATEVITLTDGGGSIYHYLTPNTHIVTGTWVYTPTTSIVELRNFRWLTATVDFPNSFFNSHYIPSGNFDVTISCSRR